MHTKTTRYTVSVSAGSTSEGRFSVYDSISRSVVARRKTRSAAMNTAQRMNREWRA